MTTARTFTASPIILPEPVLVAFTGVRISNGEAWTDEFKSLRAAPSNVLDLVAGSVNFDRSGNVTSIHQAQSIPIIRALLDPEAARQFDRLINDPDRVIDLATLWEAAMWLVGELTGRPTGGPGGSPAGSGSTPT